MKNNIKELLSIMCDWYWEFPRAIRTKIGWTLLLLMALAAGTLLWGVYAAGSAVVQWSIAWCGGTIHQTYDADDTLPFNPPKRTYQVVRYNKRNIDYGRIFNDVNDVQLAAARSLGITPIETRDAVDKTNHRLVELHDCTYYKLDDMKHSIPFLVEEAADFLLELGVLFQQYSGAENRFIITSVLRTHSDVKRLRSAGNANATFNSCHFYATTIDITYNRFDKKDRIWEGKLKECLAQALYDLREAGYCYVKYERRQACFHITVRK